MKSFPKGSILVPARNEGQQNHECLNSLEEFWIPSFDVTLIADDLTTIQGILQVDSCFVANQDQRSSKRFKPAGWVGKNHALDAVSEGATVSGAFYDDRRPHSISKSIFEAVKSVKIKGSDFFS